MNLEKAKAALAAAKAAVDEAQRHLGFGQGYLRAGAARQEILNTCRWVEEAQAKESDAGNRLP